MFNRRFVSFLANFVGLLLIFKALFTLTMYIWGFFGETPILLFPVGIDEYMQFLVFLQEFGTILFFYVVVATFKSIFLSNTKGKEDKVEKKIVSINAKVVKPTEIKNIIKTEEPHKKVKATNKAIKTTKSKKSTKITKK